MLSDNDLWDANAAGVIVYQSTHRGLQYAAEGEALAGLRAVEAAVRADERERTIQLCKAELNEAHRFEDGVYEIVTELGFTGRGLGKRTAVLDALSALATSRARARAAAIVSEPSTPEQPEGENR